MAISQKVSNANAHSLASERREGRVLESKGHSSERAKVLFVSNLSSDAIHIGGTGVEAYLIDTRNISGKVKVTSDADIVMSQASLEAFAVRIGAKITSDKLIAKMEMEMASEARTSTKYEPFNLMRLVSPHEPTNKFFGYLDIFTEKTRVGVIPVTEHVLNGGFDTVTMGEVDVRVAKPFFLIATQANPFARTNARMQRLLPVMLQSYARNREGFEAEIKSALRYISMGEQNAQGLVREKPELNLGSRDEFATYAHMVRQVATIVGKQLKNKIANLGSQLGLSSQETIEAREITADHFSKYGTGAELESVRKIIT